MRTVTFWLFLLYGLSLLAQEVPPFANITGVDFRGSGCDAESARVSITPDLQYFSVLYDRFSAEAGTGSLNPQLKRDMKNCIIVVKFELPPGWSFQFEQVEYRGFVSLPNANSTAQQNIAVDAPTGKSKEFAPNNLKGPLTDDFDVIFTNPIENAIGPDRMRPQRMMSLMDHQDGQGDGPGNGRGSGPGNGRGDGRGSGPGNGRGDGPPPGKVKHIRQGDMFDCSDRQQNATLRIRSRIMVSNQGDPANSMVKMVVDSTDATFKQKLKINWNKCLRDQ